VRDTCPHVPEIQRKPADVDICRALYRAYETASPLRQVLRRRGGRGRLQRTNSVERFMQVEEVWLRETQTIRGKTAKQMPALSRLLRRHPQPLRFGLDKPLQTDAVVLVDVDKLCADFI
jgi:hypothetical protein